MGLPDPGSEEPPKPVAQWDFHKPPRSVQTEAIDWINDNPSEPLLLLQAATGSGKSAISAAMIRDAGLILVPQNMLMEQYTADWPAIADICSSTNFDCKTFAHLDCKSGIATKRCHSACPYKAKKNRFNASPKKITNYAYYFHAASIKTDTLVCDESHGLLEVLCTIDEVLIDDKLTHLCELGRGLICDDASEMSTRTFFKLLDHIRPHAALSLAHLEESSDEPTHSTSGDMELLKRFICNADLMKSKGGDGYVCWSELGGKIARAKPLYPSRFSTLAHNHKKILLMSATLPSPKNFRKWFGSDQNPAFLNLPHTFPASNREIAITSDRPITAKTQDAEWPRIVKEITNIAKQYEGKRGLIHTVSFALTERLAEALHGKGLGKRLVTHSRNADRADCIKDYLGSPGAILLSPSVMEGFDFPDELCEFIIFVKVPYPNYGDLWVKTRAQADWDWYGWTAARNIVQGAGRGVRHETDQCDTWILDGGARRLQSFFPSWFNVINL